MSLFSQLISPLLDITHSIKLALYFMYHLNFFILYLQIKFSSLSANSVPFFPNTNIDHGRSTHSPLSVNVAEFVPRWHKQKPNDPPFQHPPSETLRIKNKPKTSITFSQSTRNVSNSIAGMSFTLYFFQVFTY